MNQHEALRYRRDIDGMRAIAVLAVCLNHARLPVFSGGFAGVDVFFVISGYLMCALIGKDVYAGRFSLVTFYERRILRILPALFAVLLVSTLVAVWLTPPQLFQDFGGALAGAVSFSSNIVFWRRSANYFDSATAWNPLLHTWSLGVEEQFYVVFPLFMMMAWRAGRASPLRTTVLLAIGSFALSVWATTNAPTANFYLLPTRAWELLIGSIVAMRAADQRSLPNPHVAGWLGITLVGASLVLLDEEMPFPGLTALAPCIGTALLLEAGAAGANPVSRLLASAPFRFFGLISYSLYLWHWPILVFTDRYSVLGPLDETGRVLALLASIAAAYASWKWVEQPFRRPGLRGQVRATFASAILVSALFAAAGWGIIASKGWIARFPGIETIAFDALNPVGTTPKERQYDKRCFVDRIENWNPEACELTHGTAGKAMLWGDSFAASWAYGFLEHPEAPLTVFAYTSPACPPILGYAPSSRPFCQQFNDSAIENARKQGVTTMVLAANWGKYIKRRKLDVGDISDTVAKLKGMGFRVVLLGQSPTFPFIYPDEYFYRVAGPNKAAEASATIDVNPALNDQLKAAAQADVFFDPIRLWCEGRSCPFKQGPAYLFSDYGHYSMTGSRLIVGELLKEMAGAAR